MDLSTFRIFVLYLHHYLELWCIFSQKDCSVERRVTLDEFRGTSDVLQKWGCPAAFDQAACDVKRLFQGTDNNSVLFDDFAHWLLGHCMEVLVFEVRRDAEQEEAKKL